MADLCHQIYDPLGYSATTAFLLLKIWSTCVVGSIWAVTPKKVLWSQQSFSQVRVYIFEAEGQ
jgi:hypothetical protein